MKKALQITLITLSFIPLIFGILGMFFGVGRFTELNLPAQLDNQFRYLSAYYIGLSVLLWWMAPNIEKHTTLLRIISFAVFLGGVGRIISWANYGQPPAFQIAAMCIELALPLVCIWQNSVAEKLKSNIL